MGIVFLVSLIGGVLKGIWTLPYASTLSPYYSLFLWIILFSNFKTQHKILGFIFLNFIGNAIAYPWILAPVRIFITEVTYEKWGFAFLYWILQDTYLWLSFSLGAIFLKKEIKGSELQKLLSAVTVLLLMAFLHSYLFIIFRYEPSIYFTPQLLPPIHLSRFIGLGGLTFILFLICFLVYRSWSYSWKFRVMALALIPTLFIAGHFAKLKDLPKDKSIKVLLVQPNVRNFGYIRFHYGKEAEVRRWKEFVQQTSDAFFANEGIDLILWPETSHIEPLDPIHLDREANQFLLHHVKNIWKTPLLTGAISDPEPGSKRTYNSAFLIRPDGSIDRYMKKILVPFIEYVPLGETFPELVRLFKFSFHLKRSELQSEPMQLQDTSFGTLICYESNFPERHFDPIKKGADILINISSDQWSESRLQYLQHYLLVQSSAIEWQTPIVRITTTGISGVIGPDGRSESFPPFVRYARAFEIFYSEKPDPSPFYNIYSFVSADLTKLTLFLLAFGSLKFLTLRRKY